MVERLDIIGENRQVEGCLNGGRMVTRMVGTCMLTDTDISSGSARGDPIEISVVLAML